MVPAKSARNWLLIQSQLSPSPNAVAFYGREPDTIRARIARQFAEVERVDPIIQPGLVRNNFSTAKLYELYPLTKTSSAPFRSPSALSLAVFLRTLSAARTRSVKTSRWRFSMAAKRISASVRCRRSISPSLGHPAL